MAARRTTDQTADLVVIGGGAGGLSAARAAARRRARVMLVQQGSVGGDCTFTGCIPSKTLIEAARRGVSFDDAMAAARQAVEIIAATETDDVLRREGIEVVHARGIFRAPGMLNLDGSTVHADRVVIATGARPVTPPIDGLTEVDYLTSETVWDLDVRPGSMAVLGAGATGCELAQALARLGSTVTLIERLDRILPGADVDASSAIREALAADGVAIRTSEHVQRVEPRDRKGSVRLHLHGGSVVDADRLLVAVGRTGAVDGLGLDAAGVATAGGFITTDARLATSATGVWAVGDVTGGLQFTHAADEMGRVAVANAFGRRGRHRFDPAGVPWVIFTDPEVGQVGLTEQEAAGRGARVGYVPMSEVDRAITAGETIGFVKLIAGPRPLLRRVGGGRVLGATIVAGRAGELIHEPALALRTGMFAGRLAQTVHAYPTWSIALRQAAAQLFMETGGRRARPAERR